MDDLDDLAVRGGAGMIWSRGGAGTDRHRDQTTVGRNTDCYRANLVDAKRTYTDEWVQHLSLAVQSLERQWHYPGRNEPRAMASPYEPGFAA